MKKIFYIFIAALLFVAFTVRIEAKEPELKQLKILSEDFLNILKTLEDICIATQESPEYGRASKLYEISLNTANDISLYRYLVDIQNEMVCQTDKKTLKKYVKEQTEILKDTGRAMNKNAISLINTKLCETKNQNLIFNGNKLIDKIREWDKIIDEL